MTDKLPEERKGAKPIGRQAAYNKAAAYFDEALDTAVWLMRYAKQESVRASMTNKLIDKVLPDLKSTELTDPDGKPVSFRVVIDTVTEKL